MNYQKILVPLDGSALAECVLPHVESIAAGCQVSSVVFMTVVEPIQLPSFQGYTPDSEFFSPTSPTRQLQKGREQLEEQAQMEAQGYLRGILERFRGRIARLESEVAQGKAAEKIAEYATYNGIDLIIIATHGRSGISRWVWGSTADKILRSACVPILMVRAPGCGPVSQK